MTATPTSKPPAIQPGEADMRKMEDQARTAIAACRSRLIMDTSARSAFFSILAMRLLPRVDWSIPTAAVDGKHLFYNPSFVTMLPKDELTAVLVHEVMHCAMGHMSRRGTREPRRWNIACDLAINCILEDAQYKLPHFGLFPGRGDFVTFPRLLSSEAYYDLLPDGEQGGREGNDPGGMGGVRDAGPSEADKTEAESTWRCEVAAAERAATAAGRGNLPAGLSRMVQNAVAPSVNWKDALRQFVTTKSRNDYSWNPPNRRFIHAGLVLPSLYSEDLGTVVVLVDTSGSICQKMLAKFAGEMEGILSAFSSVRLVILYHDTEVAGRQEWETSDGPLVMEAKGGGGTSHVPAFNAVAELAEPPTCVVCLTDGYTEYPKDPPDVPVLWAMTTDQKAPWGQHVKIE